MSTTKKKTSKKLKLVAAPARLRVLTEMTFEDFAALEDFVKTDPDLRATYFYGEAVRAVYTSGPIECRRVEHRTKTTDGKAETVTSVEVVK